MTEHLHFIQPLCVIQRFLGIQLLFSFFLPPFFFETNRPCKGSHRAERTHRNTNPAETHGAGSAKAGCVRRKTQSLELSHVPDSPEGTARAGIICAGTRRGCRCWPAVPRHNCPLFRGEQASSQTLNCFTAGLRGPNPKSLLSHRSRWVKSCASPLVINSATVLLRKA